MNVAFGFQFTTGILRPQSLSYELLTWVIPPALDPTYHQHPASQFDGLGEFLKRTQTFSIKHFERRCLAGSYRGWVEAETPADTEPSEKTHVFFFLWRDIEAETRCKDGMEEGWRTKAPWNDNFTAVQQQWEEKGLRSESLHLSLEDFKIQLMWRERNAKPKPK